MKIKKYLLPVGYVHSPLVIPFPLQVHRDWPKQDWNGAIHYGHPLELMCRWHIALTSCDAIGSSSTSRRQSCQGLSFMLFFWQIWCCSSVVALVSGDAVAARCPRGTPCQRCTHHRFPKWSLNLRELVLPLKKKQNLKKSINFLEDKPAGSPPPQKYPSLRSCCHLLFNCFVPKSLDRCYPSDEEGHWYCFGLRAASLWNLSWVSVWEDLCVLFSEASWAKGSLWPLCGWKVLETELHHLFFIYFFIIKT